MAESADRPPAIPQTIKLTRLTEIPHNRAASGLFAAALICFPTDVYQNSVKRTKRSGTVMMVSTAMPERTTPPTEKSELNGSGYGACDVGVNHGM